MAQALRVHWSLSRQTRSPCFHAFIKAHSGKNSEVGAGIWRSLLYLLERNYCSKIVFQFVYSYCGVVKNEMVDRAADHALSLMESKHQQNSAIHMDAVKAKIWVDGRMEELA